MHQAFRMSVISGLILAAASGGCTSPGKRTGIGAVGGGAGGAVIGGAIGGWKGAAIGAGVGAIAGGAVGNYLDKQAKELQEVADAKRTKDGVLVKLKSDLLFDTGKADVKAEAQTQLGQLGDILVKYPADRIRVEGFTDSVGAEPYNEALSERRAQAVRDVLAGRGVQPQQMLVAGVGEARPIASNSSSSGRAKNRRVELHIDVPPENQT